MIVTLQDLINALDGLVAGSPGARYLILSPAAFEAAAELISYLGPQTQTLRIDQRPGEDLIQIASRSVAVVGRAVLFGKIAYDVRIEGSVPTPDEVVLDLSATVPDGATWTFAANFPSLPGYDGFNPANRRIGFQPTSFFTAEAGFGLVPVGGGAPVFTATTDAAGTQPPGLRIHGLLDASAGVLGSHLTAILPAGMISDLKLSGRVSWRAALASPLLELTADLPSPLDPRASAATLILRTSTPVPAYPNGLSMADLSCQVDLDVGTGTGRWPPFRLTGPVLNGPYGWTLSAEIPDGSGYTLAGALAALARFAGGQLTVPDGLPSLDTFRLGSITLGFSPGDDGKPSLALAGVEVTSAEQWTLPLTGLTLQNLRMSWEFVEPGSAEMSLLGSLTGVLFIGTPTGAPGDRTPRLRVEIDLNDASGESTAFTLSAVLDPRFPLNFIDLFDHFTGLSIDLAFPIASFALEAESATRSLSFVAVLGESSGTQLHSTFSLDTLIVAFDYTPGSSTASLTTTATIGSGLTFQAGAAYRGSGQGWLFDAALMPSAAGYSIAQLLDALPGEWGGLPSDVASVSFTQLTGWFDTATDESGFATTLEWTPATPFFGSYSVQGEAKFSLQHLRGDNGALAYGGFLSGQLQINALTVTVQYNFGVATQPQQGHAASEAQYQFSIAYGGANLTANVAKDSSGHDILTVNLGGVSLGEILGFLVDLADPGANYRLPSPWDLLYQVNFDALTLTIDLTTKAVSVSDAIDLELGFAHVDTVSMTYADKAGVSGVTFAMTGRFGEEPYTPDSPLAWDLLNDPPPTPAGKGESALDLRFVGLGQNVGFSNPAAFAGVADVIAAMTAGFPPAGSTGPSPLAGGNSALAFAGDGRWLIGADFTVASAVALQIVFNDPALYGLHVTLSGEKVKKLAGLDFEILYKKVTDTIGVYHIDLTLPSAMRQINFSAVSLTLPTISIDIYTNGNFFIDCGFPTNMDFSKSACVQAAEFTGYGGFYFGILDGATSTQVPQIANGTFTPVVEVGLAISIGMGRTFNKGVIQAGLTIALEGSLEGVFAWFEPTDRSLPSAMFYRVVGTAELRGHLYGEVNFIVVQASLDVLAYAKLTVIVESHAPILVELELGVEVSASIKIVFFTVHFSFSTHLDLSFSIGSASPTPWILAAAAPAAGQLSQQSRALWRRAAGGGALHRRLLAGLGDPGCFDWKPVRVFDQQRPVALSAGITLTVGAAEPGAVPALQSVLSLYAGNSVAPWITQGRQARIVEIDAPEETGFNLVAAAMLRWALAAYTRPAGAAGKPPTEYALAGDIEAILDYMKDSANWRCAFAYAGLKTFLAENFRFEISSPLAAGPSGPAGPTGAAPSVTVFPMIPDLGIAGPAGTAWFRDQGMIGPEYEDALNSYYAQLTPAAPAGAGGPASISEAPPPPPEPAESLSTFIFRDYFAMVAKCAANSARAMLKSYPYQPTGASCATGMTGAESLQSIAGRFPGPTLAYDVAGWETVATASGLLGVAPAELRRANAGLAGFRDHDRLPAGHAIAVPAGASPRAIVEANPLYPLQAGPSGPGFVPLDGVKHQVLACTGPSGGSESLAAIGAPFGFEAQALFDGPAGLVNAGSTQLLGAGATVQVPSADWGPASGLNLADAASVAGFFAARGLAPPQPADGQWYELVNYFAQYILNNNQSLTGPTWTVPMMGWTGPTGPSGPNGTIPVLLGPTQYAVQGVSAPGPSAPARDTVQLAAAGLALSQLQPPPQSELYRSLLKGIAGGPSGLSTPPFLAAVPPGASVGGLAETFGLDPTDLAAANAGATGLLQPSAVLAMPTILYTPQSGDCLGSVASQFDFTLDQLADSVAGTDGLLEPHATSGAILSIPDLAGRSTDQLIEDLARFGRFNDVSGMVSRFLFHGMRVPVPTTGPVGPFPPGVTLASVYSLDGQQAPVPLGAAGPTGFALKLVSDVPWATFEAGSPTAPASALTLEVGADFIAQNSPSPTLGFTFLAGPLPLYTDQPRHYPFQSFVHWQAAGPVGLTGPSGPVEGQPSLWPLPPTLQAIAGAGGTASPGPSWGLYAAAASDPTGASAAPVQRFAWGSAIDLGLRRVRDASGKLVPNVYLLLGADEAGKELLLQLQSCLGSSDDQIFLGYSPNVGSANPQGLLSDLLVLDSTAILKAGLSTVTHSQSLMAAASGLSGVNYACASDPQAFVRLAWEASVTAQGGFYLLYRGAGGDLPPALFGGGDDATIKLVALTGAQGLQGSAALMPFNNVAVVGENVGAHTTLFARLEDPGDQVYRSAAVQPGHAGFYLVRDNPTPAGSTASLGPSEQTQSLFHLIGSRIAESADFAASNRATPVGPIEDANPAIPGPTGPGFWRYRSLLPVYRFGCTNNCPVSEALPPAAENPYQGMRGPTFPGGPIAQARIPLNFYDVFGNETGFEGELPEVEAPVGYTDAIIGVGAWPSAGAAFAFRSGESAGDILLETQLSLQPGRYAPQGAYNFAQFSAAVTADAARYAQIFYQVHQPDYRFSIATNLGSLGGDPLALKASLTAFVTKASVYCNAAGVQKQRAATTEAGQALQEIAAIWRVHVADLVKENQDQLLQPLFQGSVVLPCIAVAAPSRSLLDLAEGASMPPGGTYPPSCGIGEEARRRRGGGLRPAEDADLAAAAAAPPAPPPGPAVTALDVASWNLAAPLAPGLALAVPPVTHTLTSAASLNEAAASFGAVVYTSLAGAEGAEAPIGLYRDNPDAKVVPGVSVTVNGISYVTGAADTLGTVLRAVTPSPPQVLAEADFVAQVRAVEGLLAPQPLQSATFLVPSGPAPGLTLAGLPAGSLDKVAADNQWTKGFFAPGAPLYLGYACVAPSDSDTFASLAAEYNIPIEALAVNNSGPLKAGVALSIPGLTYIDGDAIAFATYSPRAADSLESAGRAFGRGATGYQAVATLSASLPGIFADGAIVTGPTGATAAGPGDSLASLAARLGCSLEALVDFARGATGLYRPNAAFIGPLPHVPGNGQSLSLQDLADRLNLSGPDGLSGAAMLLDANRALDGFLRPGATLMGPTCAIPIAAHDTVAGILTGLEAGGAGPYGLGDLARANAGTAGLLSLGATFLVPPDPTVVALALAPTIPPLGLTGPDAIVFPVSVSIGATRDPLRLDPDFAGATGATALFQVATAIGPEGAISAAGTIDLKAFAAGFEQAFAADRLKCAVSENKAADPDAKIWALNLGPSGASGIAVQAAEPAFYALAPFSTALINATAEIAPYQSVTGLGATASMSFASVDLDAWMLTFTSAVDMFLAPQYAAAAWQTGAPGPAGGGALRPASGAAGRPAGPAGLGPLGAAASFADGRGAYDQIVAAKQAIAFGLTGQVAPILRGVGATAGPDYAQAQETLYQQMLERLSDAYSIAAVVQYPVALDSPCQGPPGLRPYAPRLSGRIVPDLYSVPGPGPGTLTDVAAYFGVSVPHLAGAVAGARGLIADKAVATWNGATYQANSADTLASVAGHLGATLPDWQARTDFFDALAGQPLLAPLAVVPAVRIARQVQPGESALALASYFDSAVEELFEANQTLPGIFPQPTVIVVGSATYAVGPGQSLADILAANPGWSIADLADWATDHSAPLAPGVTLSFATALPDAQLSSAKLALTEGPPAPQLSFTLSLKRPEQLKNVFLNLKFVVNEVEHDIEDVPGAAGYQSSSWLSLVRPLGVGDDSADGVSLAMKQVQVPVPLRFYPTPGTLLAQRGDQAGITAPGSAEQIAQGRLWDYSFDLRTDNDAQDTTHLDVLINADGGSGPAGGAAGAPPAVFAPLAQFTDAWPALSGDLARLIDPAAGPNDPAAAMAVQVFAALCQQVAAAFDPSADENIAFSGTQQQHRYRLSAEPSGGTAPLATLQLVNEQGASGPWPSIWVEVPDAAGGPAGPAGFRKLTGMVATGATAIYNYPDDVPARVPLVHRFQFGGLDVLDSRNGWGGAFLTRNDDLIASGPVGVAVPGSPPPPVVVNADFIYQTPVVRFVNPLTPFIDQPQPIALAGLAVPYPQPSPPAERPIAQHLENMFTAVLSGPSGPSEQQAWMSALVSYGFPVAPGGPTASVPVVMMPTRPVGATGIAALAGELGESLTAWCRNSGIDEQSGAIAIDLTLYGQPVGATGLKPLLEFEALTVGMTAIDWNE